ncbi:uncharacterized protein [Gossypium hirsutum]|uniref:Uncharacterized protein isoform X1 n=2 Tax=Gossypium hirsutum TaxID=3635 RepID=A0ABM3B8R2_GOSHI|nr:uncharacterized protein LOC121224348 isoform X1 [Gossypium hirsutum]
MGVSWTRLKSFLKVLVSWIPMATNPVRYRLNTRNRFFLCRTCRNHLLTLDNVIITIEGVVNRFLRHNDVNVKSDPISTRRFLFNFPAVNVRCNGCNRHIGEQFFTFDGDRPLHRVMERSYVLHVDRLLYWDGTQVINAPLLGERRLNYPTLSSLRLQTFLRRLVLFFISGCIVGFVLHVVR